MRLTAYGWEETGASRLQRGNSTLIALRLHLTATSTAGMFEFHSVIGSILLQSLVYILVHSKNQNPAYTSGQTTDYDSLYISNKSLVFPVPAHNTCVVQAPFPMYIVQSMHPVSSPHWSGLCWQLICIFACNILPVVTKTSQAILCLPNRILDSRIRSLKILRVALHQ